MKTMKRIVAAVLAVALAVSMVATSVFAVDAKADLIIKSSDGKPLTNNTFDLYRIFNESYAKDTDTNTYSYSYTWDDTVTIPNDPGTSKPDYSTYSTNYKPDKNIPGTSPAQKMGEFYAFFFDPAENGGSARCEEGNGNELSIAMKYLRDRTTEASDTLALSLALQAYIKKHNIQPDYTTPVDGGKPDTKVTPVGFDSFTMQDGTNQVYAGLKNGYYLLEETTKSGAVSPAILLTLGPSKEVTLKTVTPEVKKTITKVNDKNLSQDGISISGSTDTLYDGKEGVSVEVGDKVTFRVDMDIPDVWGKNSRDFFWYQLVDEGDANGVLEMEDEEYYDFYRKSKDKDGNVTVEKLVNNADYVRLPHSYKEVHDLIFTTPAGTDTARKEYRKICADLVIYIFGDVKASEIKNLPDDESVTGNRYKMAQELLTNVFETDRPDDGYTYDKDGVNAEALYKSFTTAGGVVFRLTTSAKFKEGDVIVAEIDAVVTKAANNNPIVNTVKLRYTRDPQQGKPSPGNIEVTPDETPLYTHNVQVLKVDNDKQSVKLTGAVFELFRPQPTDSQLKGLQDEVDKCKKEFEAATDPQDKVKKEADLKAAQEALNDALVATKGEPLEFFKEAIKDAGGNVVSYRYTLLAGDYAQKIKDGITDGTIKDGEVVTTLAVDNAGNLNLNGLKVGRYLLRETIAPVGYALPEIAFPIVIAAQYDENDGTLTDLNGSSEIIQDTTTKAKITWRGKDVNANTLTAQLTNEKGGMLPTTGGNGTMLFTVVGGGFGVIMLALLVNELKKKKN